MSDEIAQVTIEEAKAAVEAGTAQVIDVRPSFDFAGGRVPGSLNFPDRSILTRAELLDKRLATYFISEDGTGTEPAIEAAQQVGFADVANISGGFDAWLDADYPIHTIDDLI